jgi:CBS domain containing-hemolysin-like protein
VVVNGFEEIVGIVTMEDVLEAIIGKQIVDEFDQYEDLRAVATKLADKEHRKHVNEEHTLADVQDSKEVIE